MGGVLQARYRDDCQQSREVSGLSSIVCVPTTTAFPLTMHACMYLPIAIPTTGSLHDIHRYIIQ